MPEEELTPSQAKARGMSHGGFLLGMFRLIAEANLPPFVIIDIGPRGIPGSFQPTPSEKPVDMRSKEQMRADREAEKLRNREDNKLFRQLKLQRKGKRK